jgi:hypothetical protein
VFDLQKRQNAAWFRLRLAVGYSAVVLLPTVAALTGYVILHPGDFSTAAVTMATTALFGDVLGLLMTVWKIVLTPESSARVKPVTQTTPASIGKSRSSPVPQIQPGEEG